MLFLLLLFDAFHTHTHTHTHTVKCNKTMTSLHAILYNYSLLLRSIRVFMDLNFALLEVDEFNPLTDRTTGTVVIKNVAAEAGISRSTGGRGLVVGPILNDIGWSDIFFGNEGNQWIGNPGDNFLYKNLGNGTFADVAGDTEILVSNEMDVVLH